MYWQQADPGIGSCFWLPAALLISSRDADEKKQEKRSTFGWCSGRASNREVAAFCHVILVVILCRVVGGLVVLR
jgi:hypothetical protein